MANPRSILLAGSRSMYSLSRRVELASGFPGGHKKSSRVGDRSSVIGPVIGHRLIGMGILMGIGGYSNYHLSIVNSN
jgi:hypothetical protein